MLKTAFNFELELVTLKMNTTMRNIFLLICVFAAVAVVHGNAKSMRLRRSTHTCGVPKRISGLIIRGQSFSRGSFPWIVALLYKQTEPPSFFCGGTLISSTFVLSAAHCINQKDSDVTLLPRDVSALFGANDLRNYLEPGRFALSPKKISIPDDWNPETIQYDADLSLLEFEKGSIHFNDYVQPICLWNSETESPATEGKVVGWGQSENPNIRHENVPKLITVLIESNEDCLPGEKELAGLASRTTFCAGLKNGSGVCRGDSGGGLYIKINSIHYLKGIVSSSLLNGEDCNVSKNAIYTNVPMFRLWIEKITGALKEVLCTSKMQDSLCCGTLKSCSVNQDIGSENYILGSALDHTVKQFSINNNKDVKFLPRHIGEKFPNLKEFRVKKCGLTILRNHYFKDMGNLQALLLSDNKIASIEPDSFRDLTSVTYLDLHNNLIETLDEKLFLKMVNVENLYMWNNKLKSFSLATFMIPGNEKLGLVNLRANYCIYERYHKIGMEKFDEMEADIRANCIKQVSVTPEQ